MPGVLFPFVLSPSTSSVVWIWRLNKQTNKTQISFKLLFIVNTINIQNSNYSTCNKGQTRVHYHFFLHVINNGVQFFFHFKFYRMYKCPSWMLWFYFFFLLWFSEAIQLQAIGTIVLVAPNLLSRWRKNTNCGMFLYFLIPLPAKTHLWFLYLNPHASHVGDCSKGKCVKHGKGSTSRTQTEKCDSIWTFGRFLTA